MSLTPDQRERDDSAVGQEISASSEGASGRAAEALLDLTILGAIKDQNPAPIDTFLSHLYPDGRAYFFLKVSPEKGSPSRLRAASMRVWRMRAEHAKLKDLSTPREDISGALMSESSVIYRRSPAPVNHRPEGFGERTLSREDVEDVRVFGAFGVSPLALALWMGISTSTVRRIIRSPESTPLDLSWVTQNNREKAAKLLSRQDGGMTNFLKASNRREYLKSHPEDVRTITIEPLRQILPYLEFKCHPLCSVARGEAIADSDIDEGVVVLPRGGHHKRREYAFIKELRRQGYDVYHDDEWQELGEQIQSASKPMPAKLAWEFLEKAGKMELQRIQFLTLDELRARSKKDSDVMPVLIFLAGYNIDPERTLGASVP